MFAVTEGNTICLGASFVDAVTFKAGYRVKLHGLPNYAFRVSLELADTADKAQAAAVAAVRKERALESDAATIQRF